MISVMRTEVSKRRLEDWSGLWICFVWTKSAEDSGKARVCIHHHDASKGRESFNIIVVQPTSVSGKLRGYSVMRRRGSY